jgi:pyruvate-formate lyase
MSAVLQSRCGDEVDIPGFGEPFSLQLPPAIQSLRERALALQRQGQPGIPELPLAEARAWLEHSPDEDWLLWRARWVAARLSALPLDLEPGERIVGKPLFRPPAESEMEALREAQGVLATIPPFPGGDAGHFHPDYERLFQKGLRGLLAEVHRRRQAANGNAERKTFYEACGLALQALSDFIRRTGEACQGMALRDPPHAGSWQELGALCHRIATEPPETFHEAIQLLFLTEIALWFGEEHGLTCPGRLDQLLRPFYEADLAAGRLTRREAFELICCLYIQMNRILMPGSAVAVMVGGRDRQGRDATHELTYLALAARQATRLVYPTVGLAWHRGTPEELMDFAVRMLASGVGDPAFFNDEVIVQGLRDHGVSEGDSFNYMNSTCVEIKVVGASHIWVTAPYFNLPQGLLEVMEQVARGDAPEPESFEAFSGRVRENLAHTIRRAAEQLHQVWQERARTGGFPLASCFIADCLERGQDFDRGGARYHWVENSFVGLANLVDSLTAIKHLVYERRELSLAEFYRLLETDFEGHEGLRHRILNRLPKYGNNQEEADSMAREWAEFLMEATESHTVGGHRYVPGFFCWIMHEHLGRQTGATPDGRRAGWPLADGAGGAQGRERNGPTAAVLSTTRWSHRRALGGLVHNAKFSSAVLRTESGRKALRGVIETYLQRGGLEIQVNVVSKETLLEAQSHPELYPDLLVRVAGYSDYFVHLNRNMQEEVIARTEHGL